MTVSKGRIGRAAIGLATVIGTSPLAAQQAPDQHAAGPASLGTSLVPPGGTPRGDPALRLPDADGDRDILTPTIRTADEERGTTVSDRPRHDYDPIGLRFDGFTLKPELTVGGGYDSNVFKQRSGVADGYGHARLAAELRSDWNRNLLSLDGFADERVYATYTSESAFTYGAHAVGRLDVRGRDSLSANVRLEHLLLDRGAVGEILQTRQPVRYDLSAVGASGRKEVGRLTLDLAGLASRYDYQDAEDPAGVSVDEDFRDYKGYELRLDGAYALGPGPTVFATVRGARRRFDIAPAGGPIRDSNEFEITTGVRGEITALIRGQLGLGYIRADFEDPGIKSRGGLGIDANLNYLVTELTTFSLSARREFQNVSSATVPAALTTQIKLGVDHELLRNLILSASAGYAHASYVVGNGGADQTFVNTAAEYLLNRTFRLSANAGYRRRNGFGIAGNRDYDEVELRVNLGIRY